MNTYSPKAGEIKREWHVVDAEGKVLGRLATRIAEILMGKHKPTFVPHIDVGDFVIVTNADKVVLTGAKWSDKQYYHHSGYPGGISSRNAEKVKEKFPERIIEHAVRGMLPNNKLRDRRMRKLKVYTTSDHPHEAQGPKKLEI
ncbi:MAG: 50S ribosomal protein L13 [Chloroflexi bacterium]|nr:50S ribosomal protein L13 [Chloroflexota bacterium]